ncbi:MAG: hypothetical protein FWE74_03580 [Oscillospiraceae bacterium]|nr:hypothetical protein [Oscillospiraceae bacterium]
MKNILEAFFTDHVNTKIANNNSEKCTDEIYGILTGELNLKERDLFINYADLQREHLLNCAAENFKQGFWIGCEFMRNLSES